MVFEDALPVAAHVTRAARALVDRQEGYVLGYHPVARMNPYQALLYSRANYFGFAPVGLVQRSDFESLTAAISMGVGALLHLHWTSEVLSTSSDEGDASARASQFIEELHDLHSQGVRIVWSVHNVLPHLCLFPEVEAQLRSDLAEVADVIHVMAEDTVRETSPYYRLPKEKVIKVPHPSYVGAYPGYMSRDLARFDLGYEPSDLVFGVVGSIQPYKGLSEFALAVEQEMLVDPDLRAVVAGIPGRDEESRHLVTELRHAIHIDLVARRLTDTEVATLVTALDVAVLPYRASLNSGAALLALSFGVPIVAPTTGSFRQLIEQGLGVGYEPDTSDGLRGAIGEIRAFLEGFEPARALELASTQDGPTVSEQFFTEMRSRIRGIN